MTAIDDNQAGGVAHPLTPNAQPQPALSMPNLAPLTPRRSSQMTTAHRVVADGTPSEADAMPAAHTMPRAGRRQVTVHAVTVEEYVLDCTLAEIVEEIGEIPGVDPDVDAVAWLQALAQDRDRLSAWIDSRGDEWVERDGTNLMPSSLELDGITVAHVQQPDC